MTTSYVILTADDRAKQHVRNLQAKHYRNVEAYYQSIGSHFTVPADNVFTIPEWVGNNAVIGDDAFDLAHNPRAVQKLKNQAFDWLLKTMLKYVPNGVTKATLAMLPPV